mmetsp:Transcript_2485/g.5943  ORF Transcript_2485/g.5943 Transcript_2485/m.5943 type:complete len:83 (+) Transcript_2485:983-1231(+)
MAIPLVEREPLPSRIHSAMQESFIQPRTMRLNLPDQSGLEQHTQLHHHARHQLSVVQEDPEQISNPLEEFLGVDDRGESGQA